jgi:NADH-quinone oxidoreductase subunit H
MDIVLIRAISLIVTLLISIAYFTLLERKIISAIQRRRGPNIVGIIGLGQPLADGLKLLLKETVIPNSSNKLVFLISPILTLGLSFIGWAIVGLEEGIAVSEINIGILYILAVSSLGVYGIIMAGWASNSKYAFLGGLRSAAQMVSYEVSIGIIIMSVIILAGSVQLGIISISQRYMWNIGMLLPCAIMFFVSALAETNRPPFDLPEAEAELVAGYSVEYSSMGFALFFLGECGNIILMSAIFSLLFLGSNILSGVETIKILMILISFVWIRAAFPRYRYDQLMRLGWKVFLPLSIGNFIFIGGLYIGFYV